MISGGGKLEAHLKALAKKVGNAKAVKVGFFADQTEPDGTPTAMVAAIQNFGAPAAGIPPRPFFTTMISAKSGNWGKSLGAILQANGMDAEKSLALMGKGVEGQLTASIDETQEPELSPVTLLLRERFGNNPQDIRFSDVMQARHDIASGRVPSVTATQAKPLVWTGTMRQAVGSEVEV